MISRLAALLICLSACAGIGLELSTLMKGGASVLGSAWVLLSALLYAGYLIGSGRLVGRVGSLRFASYAGLVSSIAVVLHFFVMRAQTIFDLRL